MIYEVRVRLYIRNAIAQATDFEEIRCTLGIDAPSQIWRYGEATDGYSGRTRKNDGIVYRISRTFNTNPANEAAKVLEMLSTTEAESKKILKENSGQLSIVARIYLEGGQDEPMRTPSFNLPVSFIARMCEYNLNLDVDLYVLDKDAIHNVGEWASDLI